LVEDERMLHGAREKHVEEGLGLQAVEENLRLRLPLCGGIGGDTATSLR
jgi:hypothetical protein